MDSEKVIFLRYNIDRFIIASGNWRFRVKLKPRPPYRNGEKIAREIFVKYGSIISNL